MLFFLLFFCLLDKLKKEIIPQTSAIRSSVVRWSGTCEGRWEKDISQIKTLCSFTILLAGFRTQPFFKGIFNSFYFFNINAICLYL